MKLAKQNITVKLDQDLVESLDRRAHAESRTRSNMIVVLLSEGVHTHRAKVRKVA